MNAYIIIGNPSAGKSSLVRALTGIGKADTRLLATLSGMHFTLWAKDASLQEKRVSAQKFISDVVGKGVDATLCTLWPRSSTSKGIVYPDALGYIRDFQAVGWIVQPLVLLDHGSSTLSITPPPPVTARNFSNIQTAPFNSFAASVRVYWGWV